MCIRDSLLGQAPNAKPPMNAPVLSGGLYVKKFQSGWVPVSIIQQGDWIMGEKRWTKVLGVCIRQSAGGIGQKESRITDGVWIKEMNSMKEWYHSSEVSDQLKWVGYHLLTDEGIFQIRGLSSGVVLVRDFTEVGWWRLPETYTPVSYTHLTLPTKRIV